MRFKKLRFFRTSLYFIPFSVFAFFISGCAYAPGPPPPGLGGMGMFIIGWIVIILLSLILYITWQKKTISKKNDESYVVNALNDMNKRLKEIEDKLESKVKGKNNEKEE